ncbi:cell envelope integrity protein TolA [Endozoicomonas sp.]|uniref:cell envelope integrity protein TolA n=1 Tax=Endozoicomonas sp. TaxID=1892382 RepID=UPI0028849B9A|nr:cell envelope integrity protein TolA [Endozoicomonas sp.]
MKRWFNSAFPAFFAFHVKRVSEGYGVAIALSLVLHIMMFTLLVAKWDAESSVKITPPMPISAALVTLPGPVAKPQPVRKSETQDLAAKKRKDEARKQAEVKKRAEAKKRAEQQRKEKALALKREQEQEKKEALRKKEAAARELREQEKRRQEKAQRRKEEEAREQALAMERQALQEAQQLEYDQLETAKYSALIESLTARYWNRPPSARNHMLATVQISLSRFGDIIDIRLVKSSGNDEYDRSVTQAIRLAAPFSELKNLDGRIFDQYFRRITFNFSPEDLVR